MSRLDTASDYQVLIHHRGGGQVYTAVDQLTSVSWERRLDDISTCTITAAKRGADPGCCSRVAYAEPWAHEVSVYRDGQLVWQGPLVTATETRTGFTLAASDVLAWTQKRVNAAAYNWEKHPIDVGDATERLLTDAFTQDDPNVLDYAVFTRTGTTTGRKADTGTKVVWDELSDLARYGVDLTTVGRRIVCYAEQQDVPSARGRVVLGEDAFLAELDVSRDGDALATAAVAVGQGVIGRAGGIVSPYGLVTVVSDNQQVTNQATATRIARDMVAAGGIPPTVIVVPDQAQLAPDAPVSIPELVCGRRFDLAVSSYCRPVWQPMRLSRLSASWTNSGTTGETVQVSFLPLTDSAADQIGGM